VPDVGKLILSRWKELNQLAQYKLDIAQARREHYIAVALKIPVLVKPAAMFHILAMAAFGVRKGI